VLSRNYLNNTQYKYKGNAEADTNRILDYFSGEGEIKGRFERTIIRDNGLRWTFGAGYEYAHYRNSLSGKFLWDRKKTILIIRQISNSVNSACLDR
jgi:hypothetical protein